MSQAAPPPAYWGYGFSPQQPQTEGSAIEALILSIVSWTMCPVVPAIIALVLARKADASIQASAGWRTGAGMVTAAKVISWVNLGVAALAVVVGIVAIVIAAVAQT